MPAHGLLAGIFIFVCLLDKKYIFCYNLTIVRKKRTRLRPLGRIPESAFLFIFLLLLENEDHEGRILPDGGAIRGLFVYFLQERFL